MNTSWPRTWHSCLKNMLLCTLCVSLLTACGFQLRGSGVDSALQRVHVSTERGVQILVPLRQRLTGLGISLVTRAGQPEVLVHLVSDNFDRRTVSVTGRVLAAEYELTMTAHYQISPGGPGGPGGNDAASEAVQDRHLEVSRIFAIDQGNVVGSSEEQALLMAEMREDLVQQIIRNMNTVAIQ